MKAIICGAGIAGLTLAWWLERDGWDVLLVERSPALRDEGYMIDFFGSGYDVAELMGLLPALRQVSYRVEAITNVDRNGEPVSRLHYDSFLRMQDGRLLSLLRGDLERTLHAAVSDRVEIRFARSIDAITSDQDRVSVRLTGGEREEADLLIGADGIHSRVRELTFGPESRFARYLGYQTAAYVFTDAALHARLHDAFLLRAEPGHQAGLYALRDHRIATFFAHRAPDPALPADPAATLRRLYGDLGWILPEVLDHSPAADLYYDQVTQIAMPAWSQHRVTLVGDACQAVSLLAGQGASMAMGGAYTLAHELKGAPDVAAALARYEARVKPLVEQKQEAGRRSVNWFVPGSRWRLLARDTLLRLATLPGLSAILRPVLTSPGGSIVPKAALAAHSHHPAA